jgi:hypothetical protein
MKMLQLVSSLIQLGCPEMIAECVTRHSALGLADEILSIDESARADFGTAKALASYLQSIAAAKRGVARDLLQSGR